MSSRSSPGACSQIFAWSKLNSTASRTFEVQFFSNPKGTNEGKKFIGQKQVTTDASGNASFTKGFPKVAVGQTITATATDTAGNTSEFSVARKVVAAWRGHPIAGMSPRSSGRSQQNLRPFFPAFIHRVRGRVFYEVRMRHPV